MTITLPCLIVGGGGGWNYMGTEVFPQSFKLEGIRGSKIKLHCETKWGKERDKFISRAECNS